MGAAQIIGKRAEAVRMLFDKYTIEDRLTARLDSGVVCLEHVLHDTLERRDVAADADLAILARDARRPQRDHFDRILRRREAFQRALAKRVQDHDRHATTRRIVAL